MFRWCRSLSCSRSAECPWPHPLTARPRALQESRKAADKKTENAPADAPDLDIRDGGRNAGEPENARRRPGNNVFGFHAELYSRFKDKELREGEDEIHKTGVITTASAEVGASIVDGEKSDLRGEFRFRRNFDSRTGAPDWSDYDLTLEYRRGTNSLQTTLFSSPGMLAFFRDGDAVSRDVSGTEFAYSRRLNRRLRVRTRYEFSREIFEAAKERDFARHKFRIDFKYRFHRLFYPGLGFQAETRRAKGGNFDRRELSPVLLLTSRYRNRAVLSLTYRHRFRKNTTVDEELSNYLREDRGPRLSLTSYVRVGGTLWLRLFGTLARIDSTQQRRDFKKRELGMGLRYYFP